MASRLSKSFLRVALRAVLRIHNSDPGQQVEAVLDGVNELPECAGKYPFQCFSIASSFPTRWLHPEEKARVPEECACVWRGLRLLVTSSDGTPWRHPSGQ